MLTFFYPYFVVAMLNVGILPIWSCVVLPLYCNVQYSVSLDKGFAQCSLSQLSLSLPHLLASGVGG